MKGWSPFTKDKKKATKVVEKPALESQEDPRYSGPPVKVHGAGAPIVEGSAPQYAMPLKPEILKPADKDKR